MKLITNFVWSNWFRSCIAAHTPLPTKCTLIKWKTHFVFKHLPDACCCSVPCGVGIQASKYQNVNVNVVTVLVYYCVVPHAYAVTCNTPILSADIYCCVVSHFTAQRVQREYMQRQYSQFYVVDMSDTCWKLPMYSITAHRMPSWALPNKEEIKCILLRYRLVWIYKMYIEITIIIIILCIRCLYNRQIHWQSQSNYYYYLFVDTNGRRFCRNPIG